MCNTSCVRPRGGQLPAQKQAEPQQNNALMFPEQNSSMGWRLITNQGAFGLVLDKADRQEGDGALSWVLTHLHGTNRSNHIGLISAGGVTLL